jgi:hypothetical protein
VLIGPVTLVAVIVAKAFYSGFDRLDEHLEDIAPWALLVPTAIYWIRCIATRNPLYVILTVVVGTLLLRELHWDPAIKIAAYPILVGCGVWILAWRDVLKVTWQDRRHTVWLIATLATYILAQLLERRVFKFVPGEDAIHSKIEESIEVAGHVALAIASLVGRWDYYDISQRVCSIREGFWIGPTGQTWSRITGKGPKSSLPSKDVDGA